MKVVIFKTSTDLVARGGIPVPAPCKRGCATPRYRLDS